jgi:hypothetical protein
MRGKFVLIYERRQSVMVQKPEMPHLKRLSEEFDEPSVRDGNGFVKLYMIYVMIQTIQGV